MLSYRFMFHSNSPVWATSVSLPHLVNWSPVARWFQATFFINIMRHLGTLFLAHNVIRLTCKFCCYPCYVSAQPAFNQPCLIYLTELFMHAMRKRIYPSVEFIYDVPFRHQVINLIVICSYLRLSIVLF